uniref:FCS-type domain-containing protein n=1 Tax=Ciona savignyi TaxID=51511 RepID=H2YZ86_CIOSA
MDGVDEDYILNDSINSDSETEFQDDIKLSLERQAKQKILTHVIDGFIIEESILPFQHEVSTFLSSRQLNMIRERQQEIVAKEKAITERELAYEDSLFNPLAPEVIETATCDQCGFMGSRSRFTQPSARFCSLGCARKYKSDCPKPAPNRLRADGTTPRRGRPPLLHSQSKKQDYGKGRKFSVNKTPASPSNSLSSTSSFSLCDDCSVASESSFTSSPERSPEPEHSEMSGAPRCPVRWSVDDVFTFIKSLPDSSRHAEDFRMQEIDGS